MTPGSILDETTLTDLVESSELTNEEESSLLEPLPKSIDNDVTATTASESCDEGERSVSDLKPAAELQFGWPTKDTEPDDRRDERRKERDRRLLRQHRENCRGPKKRKKQYRRLEHQIRLDRIHEEVGEENITHEDKKENKQDQNQDATQRHVGEAVAIDSKDISPTRMRRVKEIARERITKRPLHQPKNTRRLEKVSNPEPQVTFVFRMVEGGPVVRSIRLYTCAANRYAKMRSNRRFKPGD